MLLKGKDQGGGVGEVKWTGTNQWDGCVPPGEREDLCRHPFYP